MGENHKEDILMCLKEWRTVTLEQGKALFGGNIEQLEKLTRISVMTQAHLDSLLLAIKPSKLDDQSFKLLKEIQVLQTGLTNELRKRSRDLAKTIATLKKNKSSIDGYRQTKSAVPRFKSERA